MSLATIAATLEEYLASNWAFTPILFGNTEPRDYAEAGQPLLSAGNKDYIVYAMENVRSYPHEVPAACVRYIGLIVVDLYVKEYTGVRGAQTYLDELNKLFQFKEIGGIRVNEFTHEGPTRLEQGWVTFACVWPFETEVTLQ